MTSRIKPGGKNSRYDLKKGGPGVGVKPKPSPKQRNEHQDYDHPELDKNKPSEAKTAEKRVKCISKKKKDPDKKTTVGYGGPDYLGMWSG